MTYLLFYASYYWTVDSSDYHVVRPNCSFSAFRQIAKYTSSGYLSGRGSWKRNSKRKLVRFYPSLCRLQYGMRIPSERVTDCLRRQNVRYIAIIGDSNGMRYFRALHWHLSQLRGVKCAPIGRHVIINWTTYEQNNMYTIHRCNCGSTDSGRCTIVFKTAFLDRRYMRDWVLQAQCHIDAGNFLVALEFTLLRKTIEYKDYFMLNRTGCQPGRHEPVIPTISDTSQRFLLAEYFHDPRPDLFIVFGNAHDHMPLRDLIGDLDAFAALIDQYVTPPTRLIWLSRFAEDARRKPEYFRKLEINGTRLQWLDAANRLMYERMRGRFLDKKSLLLFPDLLPMSTAVLDDFNIDGVHMHPDWYQHVMSYILQTLCAGE